MQRGPQTFLLYAKIQVQGPGRFFVRIAASPGTGPDSLDRAEERTALAPSPETARALQQAMAVEFANDIVARGDHVSRIHYQYEPLNGARVVHR